jgi:hemerythrin
MLKRDPEWTSGADEIDKEHDQFFSLASRLTSLVRVGVHPDIVREAVDTLHQRMTLHTSAEERMAAKSDPETVTILREDHQVMLGAVKALSQNIGKISANEAVAEMDRIVAMIVKHERDVDVPLFRMIAKR